MKKLTIWVILSNWILYVFVPIAYRILFGKYPENIQSMGYVPEEYMTLAAIFISLNYLICVVFICAIPIGKTSYIGTVKARQIYYYLAVSLYLILAYKAGIFDYHSAVLGANNGSFLSYFSMFFYPLVLFIVFLFCGEKHVNIIFLVGAYLVITLLSHSRSGVVSLGIYLFGYALVNNEIKKENPAISQVKEKNNNKKIIILVFALALLAPVIYVKSTELRGSTTSNSSHKTIETIAARCSCLDEAGLALYSKTQNPEQFSIFDDKYGIVNQFKCIVDSTIPGSIFSGDVDPNQYYKVMVGYMSISDAQKYYSSTNLMLPIYLAIKYGWLLGSVLAVLLIISFYLIVTKIKNPAWKVALITIVFSDVLYYFDWVMVWKSFLRVTLTVMVMDILIKKVRFSLPGFKFSKSKLKIRWRNTNAV